MTDIVLVALITGIAPTLTAAATLFVSVTSSRRFDRKIDKVSGEVQEVAKAVDGQTHALADLTRKSSYAEGVKDQKDRD